ncbi:hypothetical protein K505DRAFT_155746 [Melanomma pulvis-pyrius CBS 109.77]|uniref:Uncharacterized protein n=1 Tax=Melanomma pulvis-pyrius CBS 109.77 TaxID=1314802 RepID=A0A6A6XJW4_9PLEO|nr:hypothetical protein K505DRAFT_155746 [Melanomma pulvis-pyrius CBS 109.77]
MHDVEIPVSWPCLNSCDSLVLSTQGNLGQDHDDQYNSTPYCCIFQKAAYVGRTVSLWKVFAALTNCCMAIVPGFMSLTAELTNATKT